MSSNSLVASAAFGPDAKCVGGALALALCHRPWALGHPWAACTGPPRRPGVAHLRPMGDPPMRRLLVGPRAVQGQRNTQEKNGARGTPQWMAMPRAAQDGGSLHPWSLGLRGCLPRSSPGPKGRVFLTRQVMAVAREFENPWRLRPGRAAFPCLRALRLALSSFP